ncbi:MAG: PhzF family phenazine biosynthesis protein [Rhizobacter sp.]|nr:PhzF family phenazine biosynthesis protein [Ferruginibacter sp.]
MEIKTFIIDAFTDEPFKGNPAGVCLPETALPVETMQYIAAELNLSETAFLLPKDKDHYAIRYFTPTVEVAFCGHATLASAKLLLENAPEIKLTTHHSLQITAAKENTHVKMLFPLYDAIECKVSNELYQAFGITEPVHAAYASELEMLIVEVADKDALHNIHPDFIAAIKAPDKIKELVVTCKSGDEGYDFYSRCFCPWIGINEDPVTGASHSVLAKYWGNAFNKSTLTARQLSKRGGYINMNMLSGTQMEVTSNAVIVFKGTMNI